MNTLLLDRARWDLVLDAFGNIAVAAEPYSLAQDVASALRLFKGELYYDTAKGLPYFQQVLGFHPSIEFLKNRMEAAAKTVPGVVKASCDIYGYENRLLTGSVQFTDSLGKSYRADF